MSLFIHQMDEGVSVQEKKLLENGNCFTVLFCDADGVEMTLSLILKIRMIS